MLSAFEPAAAGAIDVQSATAESEVLNGGTIQAGPNYAGENVVEGSGNRVNSDLPGGQAAATQKFGELTKGQNTQTLPNGHVVSEDNTRLRMNPDGTARVDRPATVTGGKHETIHFNKPD